MGGLKSVRPWAPSGVCQGAPAEESRPQGSFDGILSHLPSVSVVDLLINSNVVLGFVREIDNTKHSPFSGVAGCLRTHVTEACRFQIVHQFILTRPQLN